MSDRRLYFAYGSNMHWPQMQARCPGARFVCRARLPDYSLDFTRKSPARGCGVADIVMRPGAEVHGVVYAVSQGHMATLDRLEGHMTGQDAYRRVLLRVHKTDSAQAGQSLAVETYEVATKIPFVPPSGAYLALLVAGAQHWRLPDAWIAGLAATDTYG